MISNIVRVIKKHLRKYPNSQIEDIIKLIYQNEFGGGHLFFDDESFIKYLNKESTICNKSDTVDYIGNGLVRVPICLINNKEKFLIIFKDSNSKINGKYSKFNAKVNYFMKKMHKLNLTFTFNEFNNLYTKLKEKNDFEIHHSDIYKQEYNPHYRVIRKRDFKHFCN